MEELKMLIGICINPDTEEIQDIFWDEKRGVAWYQDLTDNNRYNIDINREIEIKLDKPVKSLSEDTYLEATMSLGGIGVMFLDKGYINMLDYGIGEYYRYGEDVSNTVIEWNEDDFEELNNDTER